MSNKTEDIIMKNIMELFKGDAVKFFGLDKKIVSAVRTEQAHIEVLKKTDDWGLLSEDGWYIHFEFQTTYSKKDLHRFMLSDAIRFFKEGRPIKTIVVYSSEITETETRFSAGAIQYSVEAFYMARLDGDKAYDELKAKVSAGTPLTKQDLMSAVFLPLMKSSYDKVTRLEQAIRLANGLTDTNEQLQIQAMLQLLADKYIKDANIIERLKGLMQMGTIAESIRQDEKVDIAKNMLSDGMGISAISKYTGLSESVIRDLQAKSETD